MRVLRRFYRAAVPGRYRAAIRRVVSDLPNRLRDAGPDLLDRKVDGQPVPPAALRARVARSSSRRELVRVGRELAHSITGLLEEAGAIGARREGGGSWSDDDVALAAAVTDQLAQTIESLRLLDETQNRAARERLTAEVTSRMRETLDIDTVLQTAVREMGETLGIAEVEVRMTNRIETDSSPTGANRHDRGRGEGHVPPATRQA